MKWFLLMVVIVSCCSVNMEEMDDYMVKSKCCDKLQHLASSDAPNLCEKSHYWIFKKLCQFECNEEGHLNTDFCDPYHSDESIYPLCEDLYCAKINSGNPEPRQLPSSTTLGYTVYI